MITTHRITGEMTSKRLNILRTYGIIAKQGFDRIDIIEDSIYHELKPYFDEWDFSDHAFSKFDNKELNNAELLQCYPTWQPLYPESAGDSGYLNLTYDTTNYCKGFGTGLVQKSPFRIKKEPSWGNKKAFLLHWIFDEIFVHVDIYEKIFKPIGIEKLPVLLSKKDKVITSTVQLVIPETQIDLDLIGYPKEISQACNAEKYNLINHGFFPDFLDDIPPNLQMFKSKEYFSGGAEARKMIFVTQSLRQILIKEKVNMSYYPLK